MTKMMQEHVKLMQQQLQNSFLTITQKMGEMESRLIKSDSILQN
jgi:hypothetical protein